MKRVLLLCPTTFGYEKRTREAAIRAGYDVESMDERIGNSVLAKGATRLKLLRFMPWLVRRHVEKIIARLRDGQHDTLLILNPETLSRPEVTAIREAVPGIKIVMYAWDAVSQKPNARDCSDIVDAAYSFDPEDCETWLALRHVPLFHNYREPQKAEEAEKLYDFSFVGTARLRRIKVLAKLTKSLDADGRPYRFHIVTPSPVHQLAFAAYARLVGFGGTVSRVKLDYESYLDVIRKSRCIVDIEFSTQSGLTMRTVEVAFSGVPLLTTNPVVRRYDFFDTSAVFIFDENKIDPPTTEQLVPKDNSALFEKYGIDNWITLLIEQQTETYLVR